MSMFLKNLEFKLEVRKKSKNRLNREKQKKKITEKTEPKKTN
jgi:hypothetical protein